MARDTNLRVTIDGNAAKLERAVQRASQSMRTLEREIAKGNREAAQFEQQLNQRTADALKHVGRGMVVFGAAVVAGLGMATREAIKWESAWAGVVKVLEGTPEQFGKLEGELRKLARTGFAHEEVAAVAEAAGQLGVRIDDVAGFTKVMLDLGVATNLTAEEASFAIARMSNIMGTAEDDVQRLGSVIVDLGNNSATTERDITEMALRIAGAGNIIGLSEAEVLGFAAALSSVGVESQAGGTAISRVMSTIASAAAEGGEAVAGFAEVAGMSAQQFITAFERDPAGAIEAFVAGLGRINEAGGNVFGTLSDLELGEIRVRDALLRLSGAGDLLAESLNRGNTAWDENTALVEEAQRRYDTAEVKIQAAKSTLIDLAIDVGNVLLPALVAMVETGTDIVGFFADLPGPARAVATIFAALVGVTSLVGGGFLLLAPRLAAARSEMQLLATTRPGVSSALGALGKATAAAAGAFALAVAMEAVYQASLRTATGVGEMTDALLKLRQGEVTDAITRLAEERDKLADTGKLELFWNTMTSGFGQRKEIEEYTAEIEAVDNALVSLVQSGNADAAAQAVRGLGEQLGLSGAELDTWVKRQLPGYLDALKQVEADNELAAESIDPLQNGLEELAVQFGLTGEDAEKAAEDMLKAWSESSSKFVEILGAYTTVLADKEEKERETAQATADATKDAKDSWEDYVSDVSVSVDEYLDELERQVKAQQDWQKNMLTLAGKVSAGTLDELARLGPEGAPLVAELVDASDDELERLEAVFGARSEAAGDEFARRLAEAEPVLKQIGREHGEKTVAQIVKYMTEKGVDVRTAAEKLGIQIDKGLRDGEERTIPVNLTGKQQALEGIGDIKRAIDRLPSGKKITITATGDIRVGGGVALREHGGPVKAGEPYVVGEKRPELFVPDQDGQILPFVPSGGRVSKIDIHAKNDLNATDFNRLVTGVATAAGNAAGAIPGKVLPPGSYRIGRGPAGHGYNARDLPAPAGTPIFAAASGIVTRAARLATSYGIHAAIGHSGWRSLYAHMSQMFVRTGQQVARGQRIGLVGTTGNSTGNHLHLEPDNPKLYDRGGIWPSGTWGYNGSGGAEMVLPPAATAMAMGGRGGPDPDIARLGKLLGASFLKAVAGERDKINQLFGTPRPREPLFDQIREIDNKARRKRVMAMAQGTRRELMGWAKQLERVNSRLDKARDKLKGLRSDAKALRLQTREQVADVDIAGASRTELNRFGVAFERTDLASITAQLRKQRNDARRFADVIESLRKRGLNDRTMQQLIEAGPEQGLAAAQAILSGGRAGIAQVNTLQRQLAGAGNRIGQTAADSMYKAGIRAAEGLVRGLEREERRIERTMVRIASTMVRAIKRQLGIRSPSRVFAGLGHDTARGLALGLMDGNRLVERSAAELAKTASVSAHGYLVSQQSRQFDRPAAISALAQRAARIEVALVGRTGGSDRAAATFINSLINRGDLRLEVIDGQVKPR